MSRSGENIVGSSDYHQTVKQWPVKRRNLQVWVQVSAEGVFLKMNNKLGFLPLELSAECRILFLLAYEIPMVLWDQPFLI